MDQKWTEQKICDAVMEIAGTSGVMPTHSLMNEVTGNCALSVAMTKRGGTKYFAELLGLKTVQCESKYGEEYEFLCVEQIEQKLGFLSEKMKIRYPYDILVAEAVKIDVKASRLVKTKSGSKYFTFNLEKKAQTCDIFVAYCVDKGGIAKTYIIPAYVLYGMSQLSVGVHKSEYDKYLNQWHFISDYVDFIKRTV